MRRCLRDLVALSMLSAVWSRSEPGRIAQDLGDVVCRSVGATFVYVSLRHTLGVAPVAVVRMPSESASDRHAAVMQVVEKVLALSTPGTTVQIGNPLGAGDVYLALTPIGLGGECGVLVTASPRNDFPRLTERLLLDVTANQAAVVIQHARSNETLRSSEMHFRTMADNAPALLWTTDAAGTCTYLSKQWYQFTGQTPQRDGPIAMLDGVHADDVAPATAAFRDANASQQPFTVDYRLRRADGVYRWSVNSALPRCDADGRFHGFVGAVIDVHDRKMGEARLRLLWEAASVLLSTDNPDTMMQELFEKLARHLEVDAYFNYLIDEKGELRLVSWGGVPEAVIGPLQVLRVGEGICGAVALQRAPIVAARIHQSDLAGMELIGSLGIRVFVCNPLMVDDRLIGTLAFGSRTKDEFNPDEIAVLATLTQYLTVAHERLRLVERLRNADRRKDEFLATLAHELRNPLAPVRNAARLLSRADGDANLTEQAVAIMERQLSHMVRLIDDLMDVARITTGKLNLRLARVEFSAIVMNAVEASRPLIEQMRHELTLSLPPSVFVEADAVRLTQVFSNLLNNAAKYTEPGGRISLIASVNDGHVVVRITDTGVGIPYAMLPRIFDMFTQGDRSLDRSQGGLGLGLTLVRHLTEMHGGTVSASSRGRGQGSEFAVRLPVARSVGTGEPAQPHSSRISPLRIAIVDDNKDGADSLALLLRLQGHEVVVGHDGLEAVRIADVFKPDAMILDIGLPELDGYEVARRIRGHAWGSRLLIVAVSGWGQENDKRRSADAGIDHHCVKPVQPADLERILSEHAAHGRVTR